jgi:phage terminase Nu1 subunit (DNA packaging protein)
MSARPTAPLPREPYIDARQLGAVMGVSVRTVKRMAADGMPSETWGMKRTRRFLASDAIAWARARDQAHTIGGQNNSPARRLTPGEPHREE